MRKKIVAGNWKMNLSAEEALTLANELKVKIDHQLDTKDPKIPNGLPQILLFPPNVYLSRVLEVFRNYEGVAVGVQNIHQEEKGAFTGEVSPSDTQKDESISTRMMSCWQRKSHWP